MKFSLNPGAEAMMMMILCFGFVLRPGKELVEPSASLLVLWFLGLATGCCLLLHTVMFTEGNGFEQLE